MEYSKTYEDAFAFTVGEEGGYVNDPSDPGGETNWGISKRAYPNEDIKGMTKERAKMLAYRDYWLKADCDKLPSPLNIIVFDNAYHSGVSAALENLRPHSGWSGAKLRLATYAAEAGYNPGVAGGWMRGWS